MKFDTHVIVTNVLELFKKISQDNGKEATMNRALDGSTYPG